MPSHRLDPALYGVKFCLDDLRPGYRIPFAERLPEPLCERPVSAVQLDRIGERFPDFRAPCIHIGANSRNGIKDSEAFFYSVALAPILYDRSAEIRSLVLLVYIFEHIENMASTLRPIKWTVEGMPSNSTP
jgi:hypothetical protein